MQTCTFYLNGNRSERSGICNNASQSPCVYSNEAVILFSDANTDSAENQSHLKRRFVFKRNVLQIDSVNSLPHCKISNKLSYKFFSVLIQNQFPRTNLEETDLFKLPSRHTLCWFLYKLGFNRLLNIHFLRNNNNNNYIVPSRNFLTSSRASSTNSKVGSGGRETAEVCRRRIGPSLLQTV